MGDPLFESDWFRGPYLGLKPTLSVNPRRPELRPGVLPPRVLIFIKHGPCDDEIVLLFILIVGVDGNPKATDPPASRK